LRLNFFVGLLEIGFLILFLLPFLFGPGGLKASGYPVRLMFELNIFLQQIVSSPKMSAARVLTLCEKLIKIYFLISKTLLGSNHASPTPWFLARFHRLIKNLRDIMSLPLSAGLILAFE